MASADQFPDRPVQPPHTFHTPHEPEAVVRPHQKGIVVSTRQLIWDMLRAELPIAIRRVKNLSEKLPADANLESPEQRGNQQNDSDAMLNGVARSFHFGSGEQERFRDFEHFVSVFSPLVHEWTVRTFQNRQEGDTFFIDMGTISEDIRVVLEELDQGRPFSDALKKVHNL